MKKTFLFSVVALLSISLAFMGCPNDSGSGDDDDNTPALSSDKDLVSVFDSPAELEEGSTNDGSSDETAKPYTVSLPSTTTETTVTVTDIEVSDKAKAALYSDVGFEELATDEGIALETTVDTPKIVYVKVTAEDGSVAHYKVSITISSSSTGDGKSAAKSLTNVLGATPTPEEGSTNDGSSDETAKPYILSLATTKTAVTVTDIGVSEKAKAALYSDAGFSQTATSVPLAGAGVGKDVYIKVTAENDTAAFYKVKITVTTEGAYAVLTSVDGSPITGIAGTKLAKAKDVKVELFNTSLKNEDKVLKKNLDLIAEGWIVVEGLEGLTAKLKDAVTTGATSFTLTVNGTQVAPLNEPLALTIPSDYLSSGKELAVSTDANAQLTFTWKELNKDTGAVENADIFDLAINDGSLVGEDIKVYVKKDWKEVRITTIENKSGDYIEAVGYTEGDEPEEGVPLLTTYAGTAVSPASGVGRLILPVGATKGSKIKVVITEEAQESQIGAVTLEQTVSPARALAVSIDAAKVKVDPINDKVTVATGTVSIKGNATVSSASAATPIELIVSDGAKLSVGTGKSLAIGANGTLTVEDGGTVVGGTYFTLGAGTWKSTGATITPNTLTLDNGATLGSGETTATVLTGGTGNNTFTASGSNVTLSQDGDNLLIVGKSKTAILKTGATAGITVNGGLNLETGKLDISESAWTSVSALTGGITLSGGKKITLENSDSIIIIDGANNTTALTGKRKAIADLTFGNDIAIKGATDTYAVAIGSLAGDVITSSAAAGASTLIGKGLKAPADVRSAAITGASSGTKTIAGTKDTPLPSSDGTITITLTGDTVKAGGIPAGSVAGWFNATLPGWVTSVTATGSGTTITITVSGVPVSGAGEVDNLTITIPASSLSDGAKLETTDTVKFAAIS